MCNNHSYQAIAYACLFKCNSFSMKLVLFLFLAFTVMLPSGKAQITEGFEEATTSSTTGGTGMPTAYSTGNYILTYGTWIFNNAKRATSGTHNSASSCLLGSASGSYIASPIIATGGVDSIVFWGSVSTGPAYALQVSVSKDGAAYTQIGSNVSLTTTATRYAISVKSNSANIQVKFQRVATTVYLDDINIQTMPVIVPTITASGILTTVNTTYGSASLSPSSFTVSGSTMNAGILITPPTSFEVSISATTGYAPTISIGAAGTIASTPIYVRLKATATAGNYSGSIILSSSGATPLNVATVLSTVAPYSLHISGLVGLNKIYDGTLTASLTGEASLSSAINGDVINIVGTPVGTFVSSIVGNGKVITITGFSLTGLNNSSYVLSTTNTTANIIPVALTIEGSLVANKTYDGTNTATLSGTLFGIITCDISNVLLNATAIFSQTMVANNITVTSTSFLSGSANGNYTLTQPLGLVANIIKATQTISFTTFATPINTLTTGFLLNATSTSGNTVSFISSNLLVATILVNNLSVVGIGTSLISAFQMGDTNYYAATITSQTLVVNQAPIIIYQQGFESGLFGDTFYTQSPTVLSNNLNNTRWTIKTGVLQSYSGSGGTGTGSLGVLSGASASPMILTLNIQNGYSLNLNSFSFWRQTSGTISWVINVNGVSIGSGFSPTSGSNTGTIPVLNAINGLTGIVKIQILLSGSGSFRIDDFTLNGNLISCGVLPEIVTQPIAQTLCSSTQLNLNVIANNVNTYQWRKSGINIAGSTNASYSILNCTNADAGSYDVVLTGASYCATSFSSIAQIIINPSLSGVNINVSSPSVCSGLPVHLSSSFVGINESFESFPLTNFSVSGTGASYAQNNIFFNQGSSSVLFNTTSNGVINPTLTLNRDIDLTRFGNSPDLQFYHICALEGTNTAYDYGFIEYSLNGGTTWSGFPSNTYNGSGTLVGTSGNICFSTKSYTEWNNNFTDPTSIPVNSLWKKEVINLSSFISNSRFRIRFRISTDLSGLYYGWLIDNLSIGSIPSGYSWSSIPTGYTDSSQNPLTDAKPLVTTNYILTALNNYGCSASANSIVNVKPSPSASIHYANTPFCITSDSQRIIIADTIDFPYTFSNFTANNGLQLDGQTGTILPSINTIGNYTVLYNFTGANSCTGSASSNIEISKVGLWKCIGVDSNWNNFNNWGCSMLPSAADNVVISNISSYYPIITDSASVHDLNIEVGARLTINGTMNAAGSIYNAGMIDASKGHIVFNGSLLQNIHGGFIAKNISLNNQQGVTLGNTIFDTVFVTGLYNPTSGSLTTNGRLVLVSNSIGTASVGIGTGDYISGLVNVQRHHANKRAWLLITAPLTAFGSNAKGDIKSNWQQQTYITAPAAYSIYGMDTAVNNTYTLLNWNGSAWGRVTNTIMENSLFGKTGGTTADNKALMLFIRGDRTVKPISGGTNSTSVILQATGEIQKGNKDFDISSSTTYALIANPYPAPINLTSFVADNRGLLNGNTYIYYWDPNSSGSGSYTTAIYNGNSWAYSGKNTNNTQPSFIQSGQAFFVIRNAVDTIKFKESQKNINNSSNTVFGSNGTYSINIDLSKDSTYIDGVLGLYNNSFSAAVIVPKDDAIKFWGNEEGIAIVRDGINLSVEARPAITDNDTLYLFLNKIVSGSTYNLAITGNSIPNNIEGAIIDKYLNIITPLNIAGITRLTFYTDSSLPSKSALRFMIVFHTKWPLSNTAIKIKAKKDAQNILINWSMLGDEAVNNFSIERSNDGHDFSVLYTINTNSVLGSSYDYVDHFAITGDLYYRIMAMNNDGTVDYSAIVPVLMDSKRAGIRIYPNPVTGGEIAIAFNNLPVGAYTLLVYNAAGLVVLELPFVYKGGGITDRIKLPIGICCGVYRLTIMGVSGAFEETMIVD